MLELRDKGAADVSSKTRSLGRREVLRLGAAGMPMVMTMRASANEALISQLRCTVTIPSRTTILIHADGRVWISRIRITRPDRLNSNKIRRVIQNADYFFPAGTAPSRFRPEGCEDDDDDDDDDNCNNGNGNGNNGQGDFNNGCGNGNNNNGRGENGFRNKKSRDDDDDDEDDDNDDDDEDDEFEPCDYKLIYIEGDTMFPISDVISDHGATDFTDVQGLYVLLAINHAEGASSDHNFPGVSCIVSVLDYLKHR